MLHVYMASDHFERPDAQVAGNPHPPSETEEGAVKTNIFFGERSENGRSF